MTTCTGECSFSNALNRDDKLDGNSFSQELDSFERSFSEKLANLKKAAHSTCISHRSKSCTDAFYTTPKCSKLIEMTNYVVDENTNPNTPTSSLDTYVFRSPNKRTPLTDITKNLKTPSPNKAVIENQSLINENNKLSEKVKKLEKENKSMKKMIDGLKKEKQNMIDNNKEKENDLNNIISRLNKEIEELKTEKEKIERMKSIDEYQSNQNILFYTTKLESYERLYADKENRINKLNINNSILENELEEMKQKIILLKQENKEYKSDSNRMIEDLTYQNKSLESKCAALNQMYEDLKKELSNKRKSVSRSPRKHYLTKKNNNSTVFETIFDYSPTEKSIDHERGDSLVKLDDFGTYMHYIIYIVIILFIYTNV